MKLGFASNSFPCSWKKTLITLIPKNESASRPSDFRPALFYTARRLEAVLPLGARRFYYISDFFLLASEAHHTARTKPFENGHGESIR